MRSDRIHPDRAPKGVQASPASQGSVMPRVTFQHIDRALPPIATSTQEPPSRPQQFSQNHTYEYDGLEGLRRLKGRVSVIVTSPPYNIGKPYSVYDDSREEEDYLAWMGQFADACSEALGEDGSLFLNIGGKPSDPAVPLKVALEFIQTKEHPTRLALQNTIIWVKSIAIPKEDIPKHHGATDDRTFGHYQPINGPPFLNGCFEYIFHFTKSGRNELDKLAIGVSYQDKSNVSRWRGKDRRDRGNTWFIPYETINESRPHPATFPTKLPEMCIQLHGIERARHGLVVDPFMGIGSTGVACSQLGVPFLGFDIDPSYVAIAEERVSNTKGRKRNTRQEGLDTLSPSKKTATTQGHGEKDP